MSESIYIHLAIILASIILVQAFLILFIVWQTMKLRKKLYNKIGSQDNNDKLWIKPKSESLNNATINSLAITSIPNVMNDGDENSEEHDPNNIQMITFTKRQQQHVHNKKHQQHHHHHHRHHSKSQTEVKRFPTPPPQSNNDCTESTELSDYCEPNS